jgi:hypothetical protein
VAAPWNAQRVVGSVLLAAALLVFIVRFQLGHSFSVTAQARKLVTHGLYSKSAIPFMCSGQLPLSAYA